MAIGGARATATPAKEIGEEGQMTDRSLINDPSDFIPTERSPTSARWAKWFEGGEHIPSLVSECIDYEVDFVVKETAEQRARRKWGMAEPEQ
jgi:hypothetical protein